ncbi:DUF29 domain-containing protein [Methylobacterium frigidaeris]|uniref:DUF29 domain-containing protein n=1 Tax=Methylobacterium frigidaeris TaxID=2038277 RepID=A0AA37HGZ7_9HYPH|nr:DUF29 domain-containing protein [Methylobacterium frigidaeris]PIK73943.1 hypothetical protein CS379_05385 [Methylobacterium frigidaeris]GJD65374.1 hypothetical protein MPEAHAMD_5562 [Methylobacterium frigidaeris]
MADPVLSEQRSDEARPSQDRARYEDDTYAWALEQARLLRAGRLDAVDAEHVAEELESLGKSEFAKLRSGLRVLVMHMLKWDQQPEHRTASWIFSIREQRRRYEQVIRENPSLRPRRPAALAEAYEEARLWAANETHLQPEEFPGTCPYTWDDLLDRPFDFDSLKK